jgi:o-succinylbenzoate---CoA ligase
VSSLNLSTLRAGDVVAVLRRPGSEWRAIVDAAWSAEAVVYPVDLRLPTHEVQRRLARALPTVVLEPNEGCRRVDGVRAEGAAVLIATSGATGEPKLVELGRAAVEAAVISSAAAIGRRSDEGWLCCLPLAHIGGLLVVLRSVLLAAPLTIRASFDAASVGALGAGRYVSLVPTMLEALLDARVDVAQFAGILVGGGALDARVTARADAAGARVIETYGLTESCGGVVYDGRPLEGVGVRLDSRGNVELLGPTLMDGYRLDPAATAAAFTPDGWLRTADTGTFARNGRLVVLGRSDDVIVSGGENVRPEDVEAAIRGHPAVAEVAVAGRDDPRWGRRVVAFVVATDPSAPPSLNELRDFAAGRLPRSQAPREVVIVDDLPRTAAGKLRRSALPR